MNHTILNRINILFISFGIAFSMLACQGQQTQAEEATSTPGKETTTVATSEKMSPATFLSSYKATEGAQLIDVRTPQEVATGKVAGATMINYRDGDFVDKIGKLDKEKPVFIYCRSGGRSGQAAAKMERMGFVHIVDMKGGMMAWDKAGLPVEK